MQIPSEIQTIIARIPAWQSAREFQLERIAGLTNANYRLNVDGEPFVLRVSGQNTASLGINRAHEASALQAACAAGIAPELIACLQPEGHLVTRWVDGRIWDPPEFRTPQNVRLLTETVKRIHALPPSGAEFSPFLRINSFLQTAQSHGIHPPSGFEQFLEIVYAVESDQMMDESNWQCFCHNDLVSCNYLFVKREQTIKVLDWEFSGWGDCYYDLATIVFTHDSDGPIPPELEDVMVECYFGEITPQHRRRLAGMKFMLMLFSASWGLAQAGMQTAGLIPVVEGFDYLEFSQYLFANDLRDLQAQYLALSSTDS